MRRPEFIARQGGMPKGVIGSLVARIMRHETGEINRQVADLLGVQPGENVLDVGAGNGISLRHLADMALHGHVTGLDHSAVMCRRAQENNRQLIREDRVQVINAPSDAMPFDDETFDAVMSVHTLYFWDPAEPHLQEIARVLRPGARIAIAFRPDSDPMAADFPQTVYRFRPPQEVGRLLSYCGFENLRYETRTGSTTVVLATRNAAVSL